METRSRILIVDTNPMIYDGIFSAIINYVENIDKTDMDIDFVSINTPDDSIRRRIKQNDSKLYTLNFRNHNPFKYVIALFFLIRKNKYTLVHVHGSSCIMAVELLASKLAGVPCCPHSHNTNCQHKTTHRVLKPLFNILYIHGFACGEKAGKWLYGNRQFDIIRNGISCEKYRYSDEARKKIRKELEIPDEATVLLSVAHFSEVKNHAFMVELMREVIKKNTKTYLVCVGIGKLMDQTKDSVRKFGLESNVKILGLRQDVPDLLSAADIQILPSHYEGFPFTLIEAQASGIDCLVSSVVTKECCFSDNMKYIPLELEVWANEVWAYKIETNRSQISDKNIVSIRKAGYDISITASTLKDLYLKYEKRRNND